MSIKEFKEIDDNSKFFVRSFLNRNGSFCSIESSNGEDFFLVEQVLGYEEIKKIKTQPWMKKVWNNK